MVWLGQNGGFLVLYRENREKGQTNSILGAGARGVFPPNNLNLEALKFWKRFVSPNHNLVPRASV
jgi:hypothetical protein